MPCQHCRVVHSFARDARWLHPWQGPGCVANKTGGYLQGVVVGAETILSCGGIAGLLAGGRFLPTVMHLSPPGLTGERRTSQLRTGPTLGQVCSEGRSRVPPTGTCPSFHRVLTHPDEEEGRDPTPDRNRRGAPKTSRQMYPRDRRRSSGVIYIGSSSIRCWGPRCMVPYHPVYSGDRPNPSC